MKANLWISGPATFSTLRVAAGVVVTPKLFAISTVILAPWSTVVRPASVSLLPVSPPSDWPFLNHW